MRSHLAQRPVATLALPEEDPIRSAERLAYRLAVGERLDHAGLLACEHLATGGKRFRARLAISAADALGVERDQAVPWAAAVEVLHNATLVHDDLQDGDRMRRGRATVWARHGVAQAINTGDLLLMLPWLAIAEIPAPEALRYRLCAATARRAQRTVRGQVAEMELLPARRVDRDSYLGASRDKTGQLIALPVEGAALLAGLSPERATTLARPFEDLGILFQLQDDLIDLYGDKGREAPGADIREGKVSALVVAHLERVPDDFDWLLSILLTPRDTTSESDITACAERFSRSGAAEAVLDDIDTLATGIRHARGLGEVPAVRSLAEEMTDRVLAPLRNARLPR